MIRNLQHFLKNVCDYSIKARVIFCPDVDTDETPNAHDHGIDREDYFQYRPKRRHIRLV